MMLSRFSLRLMASCAALFLVLAINAMSAVPTTISYQGRLTNADGNPVADGDYQCGFALYDAAIGSTVFWSETHPVVNVTAGLFSVLLGSITPFPLDGTKGPAKAGETAWLTVSVNGGPESDPRIPLVSVLAAFNALRADSAWFAFQAARADTAWFTTRSTWSDSADFAFGSMWSDTAGYASGSGWSDTSDFAFSSGWADTSDHAMSVAEGSINNAELADGSVDSRSIADGSIALSDIGANGAVDGQVLKWNLGGSSWVPADDEVGSGGGGIISVLPGSGLSGGGSTPIVTLDVTEEGIGPQHIDTGAVRNSELAINAVAAENIQPQVIDNSKIAINTITGDRIANKTIGGGDMADSTIGWQQLKPNAVIGSRIAPNTVDTSDIGTGGVGSDEIIDGSIAGSDIADGSITGADIASGSLTGVHILTNSIGSIDLGTNSVGVDELATNAVGEVELQTGAVTGSKLAASSVDSEKIMNNSITAIDLSHNSVGNDELTPDAVSEIELRNGAVTETKIANNAVRSNKVQDSSLFAHDLADEPGVASLKDWSAYVLPDTAVYMGLQTIDCPAAGYLFVSASIGISSNNAVTQESRDWLGLRMDNASYGGGGYSYWTKTGESRTIIPLQFVFPVSAGSHFVEIRADHNGAGTTTVRTIDLVLLFIPTAYGSIAAPSKSGENGMSPEAQR